jgi:hypothetical protein
LRDKSRFPVFIGRMEKRNNTAKNAAMLALLAGVGALAYFVTTFTISQATEKPEAPAQAAKPKAFPHQERAAITKRGERENTGRLDMSAINDGAIPNQRVIVFKDQAALAAFLGRLGDGVNLLGRLDKLNALHVGFGNEDDLLALLDGTEETGFIYPVNVPEFSTGPQAGAAPLGNGLLEWLGVTGDNSLWGKGIKIAILDTGIADHIAFRNAIERINLVPLPANAGDLNAHGTAVASLIFSSNPLAPGIAPAATPLSVRIADDNGSSNSFLIAQGIIAAVDAGAQLINISLGGNGRSGLVENALAYAQQAGVIVIAAAGNTGTEGVMQPAASPLAIAVGAVDARNQPLAFSTTGNQVALAAPGYAVSAAYPGNQAASVTGTSFSSPIVTGVIAATMSRGGSQNLSGTAALGAVNSSLVDIGAPGGDPATGGGVPDMWRILNGNTRGVYDAAVTSITTVKNPQGTQAQVLVQNLGTETLVNAGVSVNVNGVTTNANITTLAPGDTRVITVPVSGGESLNIQGGVRLSGGQTDHRPSNDSLSQSSPAP